MNSKNYLSLYHQKLEVVTKRLDDTRRGIWLAKVYEYDIKGTYEPTGDELLDALIEMTIPDLEASKAKHQQKQESARASALKKHYPDRAEKLIDLYGVDEAARILKGEASPTTAPTRPELHHSATIIAVDDLTDEEIEAHRREQKSDADPIQAARDIIKGRKK